MNRLFGLRRLSLSCTQSHKSQLVLKQSNYSVLNQSPDESLNKVEDSSIKRKSEPKTGNLGSFTVISVNFSVFPNFIKVFFKT